MSDLTSAARVAVEPWIAITLLAAGLQNARSALQKKLTEQLDATEASYVRFCFALPFALAYVLVLVAAGLQLPLLNGRFLAFAFAGGMAQIVGTVALIRSFSYRTFAVGTAYSKTEAVQTVPFSLLLIGEGVSWGVVAGIGISLAGVLLLSPRTQRVAAAAQRSAWIGAGGWFGMGAGAGFACSTVCYRAASLSLDGDAILTAALTLLAATTAQTIVMGGWISRRAEALHRIATTWRTSVWVGFTGMTASAGWFTAMTLQSAPLVRALGQVELLFAFVVSLLVFREHVRIAEVAGSTLIVVGIALVLLLR